MTRQMPGPSQARTAYDPKSIHLRKLVTPEGVDLGTRLADMGQRFGALALDLLFLILFILIGAVIVGSATGGGLGGEIAVILIILIFFIVRNFYFMLFEMGPKAATPGKRILKIRVVSRTSASLDTSAVFARNAMREIELFIPLSVMLSGGTLTGQNDAVDGWIWLAALIWVCVFAFFPLFNRDRLRVGDLIAGTWVVRAPKPILLEDLSEASPSRQFAFRPDQIAAYGIRELHVLEDVLRARDPKIMSEVADRIRTKIGWTKSASESDIAFLQAYYADLRRHLESGLLMGRRRKDKFDTA